MEHAHDINGQVESPIIEDSKKDIGGLFSSLNPWVLFAAIVVCYMVVMLLGGYLGRVRMIAGIKEPETSMETAVAAVLGLLAFILGFTFSITWNKFANRNGLVIEHAKAISICYLRASLIPEKQKLEIRKILHEYMQVLLHIEDKNIERSLLLIDHLHIALWRETVSLAKEDMDGELRSIFIGSVNDLMSLSMERKTIALFIRVPNAIWRTDGARRHKTPLQDASSGSSAARIGDIRSQSHNRRPRHIRVSSARCPRATAIAGHQRDSASPIRTHSRFGECGQGAVPGR